MSNEAFKADVLYTIFEKHLYDFNHEDDDQEAVFIENIVADYVQFLTKNNIIIPKRWQMQVLDELRDQVKQMLVKKMYGCISVKEYLQGQKDKDSKKKSARKKFSKMF